MKRLNYWIVLVVIVYGSVEALSYGGLLLLSEYRDLRYEPVDGISARHSQITRRYIKEKISYRSHSPTLGWSTRENGSTFLYQTNASGIRSNQEYALTPPRGVRRVSTFGDSFTHGSDVKNDHTWQAVMEGSRSNLEALNFGVGGFGLDQSYLRYLQDGIQYNSHIVLIGFMPENIYRTVNTYRPFYIPRSGTPLAKPRFVIQDGTLALIPNPMQTLDDYKRLLAHPKEVLSEIGTHDHFYKKRYTSSRWDWSPTVRVLKIARQKAFDRTSSEEDITTHGVFNEESEAFRVTQRIFEEFRNAAIENGSVPIILILPARGDVARYRRKSGKIYSPLLSYFDSRGYRYVDLMDAFENAAVEDLFGLAHYSVLANKLVGKYVVDYLDNMRIKNTARADS